MAGGEAAHEGVERSLAPTLDLIVPVFIVSYASLSGRHDPNGAAREHQALRAQRRAPGFRAFVIMTRTNFWVYTSAIVSRSSFLMPALTNNMSNTLDATRARSAET